jgi:hypothetical protein
LPFDVAVSEVEGRIWNDQPHNSDVIREEQWALAHLPLERELLFVKGFAGADARFLFGASFSQATSYTCQEVKLPPDPRFHSRFHFGLDYRPDLAKRLDERDLPIPRGFSGSLVWNTRFVETHLKKETWRPDCALGFGKCRQNIPGLVPGLGIHWIHAVLASRVRSSPAIQSTISDVRHRTLPGPNRSGRGNWWAAIFR